MISQLTFTRFIAAFLIVFLHYGAELFTDIPDSAKIIRDHLHLGVSYFFVLSGYVMMIAYSDLERIDFKNYIINRLSRIYPTHVLALFLTIFVSILSSINYLSYYKFDTEGFMLNLLLLQAWSPNYALSFNIPSWSISVELFFYVCFPFLFNCFIRKVSIRTVIITCIIFWITMQVVLNLYYRSDYFDFSKPAHKNFLFYNPVFNFSSFLIGCLAGLIYKTKKYRQKNYDFIIILLIFLTTFCIIKFHNLLLQNGLLSINFALVIIALSLNNGYIARIFKNKKLVYLGDISFAMYLLQFPIFTALNKINTIVNFKNPYIYFIIGFSILLVCSHLVFRFFENPLRKKIKTLFI
ncbi:acyltransferase family protein [Epilithonimonas zeae]|uniref:acyltransferase family protein n=1 Tax=Epilithonimonas zeae TaxID=1416779 RepID=UPI00200EF5FC|nr:acyltransferase [Epilithonimonas zeae]UQB67763.1 acyltransferase [Epilithonimonas zeae]